MTWSEGGFGNNSCCNRRKSYLVRSIEPFYKQIFCNQVREGLTFHGKIIRKGEVRGICKIHDN